MVSMHETCKKCGKSDAGMVHMADMHYAPLCMNCVNAWSRLLNSSKEFLDYQDVVVEYSAHMEAIKGCGLIRKEIRDRLVELNRNMYQLKNVLAGIAVEFLGSDQKQAAESKAVQIN